MATGEDTENPKQIYERIMARFLEYREELTVKQTRLDDEWAAHTPKGNMSAHQFYPVFEKMCFELDEVGLGKSKREKFLSICEGWVSRGEVRFSPAI